MFRHGCIQLIEVELSRDVAAFQQLALVTMDDFRSFVRRSVVPHNYVMALVKQIAKGVLEQIAVVVTQKDSE
jgi:hypothetical protein